MMKPFNDDPSDATRDLISAIASVAAHKPFFTSKVTRALLDRFVDGQVSHQRPSRPKSAR
jgi:hypothetical protein